MEKKFSKMQNNTTGQKINSPESVELTFSYSQFHAVIKIINLIDLGFDLSSIDDQGPMIGCVKLKLKKGL